MSIQNILSLLLKFVLDKGYTSKAMILDNLEENKTAEQIIEKLIRRFSLSPEAAREYYCQFDRMEDI